MRPPLYQLLSRFTPPVTFAPSIPESLPTPRPAATEAASAESDTAVDTATVDADTAAVAPADSAADDTAKLVPDAAPDVQDSPADVAPEEIPAPADSTVEEEKPAGPPPRIVHRPRIAIDGRVLLTRRRWLVPGVLLPQRGADEGAADYFVRANRWCREAGLPESCYLRVLPLPDPAARKPGEAAPEQPDAQEAALNVGADAPPAAEEAEAPEAAAPPAADGEGTPAAEGEADAAKAPPKKVTSPSRDFYKPQFMDFGNPLLVGLLGKIGAGLKHFNVVFEERLPGRESLPRVGGKAYATEMVIQLNFPEGAAGPEAAAAVAQEASVV
jgi:hypothetical protein